MLQSFVRQNARYQRVQSTQIREYKCKLVYIRSITYWSMLKGSRQLNA